MKYSKPTLELEGFDVEDIITASGGFSAPETGSETGDVFGDLSVGDFDFQGDFVF